MNRVLCDGGLSNRLNALLFALVLKRHFKHDWSISWPINNWCGAPLESLFVPPLPVDSHSLKHYRERSSALMLMQENQLDFPKPRLVLHQHLPGLHAYAELLNRPQESVYFHNLIPVWADAADVHAAVRSLELAPDVAQRARAFCDTHAIDRQVIGLHIRKTDFGDRIDDEALFDEVSRSTQQRYFVCSDSADVNRRFTQLPNCDVFEKTAYPEKVQAHAGWLHWTTDADGRNFPYNIERGAQSVIEGLIDLLILSRTEMRVTSGSTFLAMARLFQAAGFFSQAAPPHRVIPAHAGIHCAADAPSPAVDPGLRRDDGSAPAAASPHVIPAHAGIHPQPKASPMNAPLEARKFDLSQVDENEHLIPRPYGTLQTLNLDHLYRYAFAKGFCYNADVLDAAMGCGYASLLLNCKSYTGVDIDPNMVAFANEVYLPMTGKGRYLQGSVLELPVPDRSIDTFISFETIEHIQPGEVGQYFAEVKRVLRPGGRFLCSTPIYRGDKFGLLTRYHPYEFRYQQFEATLLGQGLAIVETLYQWPPHFTLEHVTPTLAQTQQAAPFLTVCVCQLPA